MRITDLLTEINIDVLRLIAVNSDTKATNGIDSMNSTLKKFKSMFDAMRNKSIELDDKLGFFEKRELKKDLHKLINTLHSTRTDDRWKVFEASNILSKLCSKYGADYEYDTSDKIDVNQVLKEQQEAFNPGLEDRISDAFKAAKEKRAKYGVREDTPATTLDVNEIKEAAERTLRIDSAIAKKKAEKKSRSIDSMENARYESVMARKIKELLKDFDEEEKQGDTVSIRYEYQNNTYYLDGEPVIKRPKRLTTAKEKEEYIRSKIRNQSEFGFLFDTYIPDERTALKNCDPYIIELLLSKDIRLARDYIKQLSGNEYRKSSPQNFKVTYDVRGLESGRGGYISSKERRSIRRTAKQQKNAAKVLEDKRKLPWYAAIPVVGALAIAGIAGLTGLNSSNHNNDKETLPENSYSDTLTPGTTTEQETTEVTTTTTAATTQENVVTTITTNNSNEKTTTVIENDNNNDNYNNGNKDNKEEKVIINIGDKISVQDGLKYTADCLGGGNSNRIGAVSWRPATEYNVERVAFTYQGRILKIMNRGDLDVEKTLNEVADKNGINVEDINTSVLLSLVPGIADTGWANISIDDMRENIAKPIQEQSSMVSHVDFDFDR